MKADFNWRVTLPLGIRKRPSELKPCHLLKTGATTNHTYIHLHWKYWKALRIESVHQCIIEKLKSISLSLSYKNWRSKPVDRVCHFVMSLDSCRCKSDPPKNRWCINGVSFKFNVCCVRHTCVHHFNDRIRLMLQYTLANSWISE